MSEKNIDVVAVGELLVDMISAEGGVEIEDASGFTMASGGAVGNVAIGCARLGLKSAFIGKVGDDPFGRFLKKNMESMGVETGGLKFSDKHKTPLVFVSLDKESKPKFLIYNRPGADLMMEPDDVDVGLIRSSKALHFGSVTLSVEPSRSATLRAVQTAIEARAMISYDPNIRLHMWDDDDEAIEWADRMIPDADVLKVSEDETDMLLGTRDPERAADELLQRGPKLVLVTLGARGAYFACEAGRGMVEAPKVHTVDTTGAGDAFVAGLLKGILSAGMEPFAGLSSVRKTVETACAAAALTTESMGAVAAFPDYDTVKAAMADRFNL